MVVSCWVDGWTTERARSRVEDSLPRKARSRRYTKAGRSANLASEIATSEPPRFIEQARRASIRRSQPFGFYRTTGHEMPRSRPHGMSRKLGLFHWSSLSREPQGGHKEAQRDWG